MSKKAAFTGEDIKAMFQDPKIRIIREADYNLPSDVDFQCLASLFNRMISSDQSSLNDHIKRVRRLEGVNKAAKLLRSYLSEISEYRLDVGSTRYDLDGLVDSYLRIECIIPMKMERDLESLERAMSQASLMLGPTQIPSGHWHDYIGDLERALRIALRSTNGKVQIGRSNSGILARFLCASINLISGERVAPSTAIRALGRKFPEPLP